VVSDEIVEKGSSQIAALAPKLEAKREARTPPLPAPIVKRSKSYWPAGSAPFCDSARTAKVRRGGEREIRVLVERDRGREKERENGKVLVKKRVFRVRVGEQQERESEVAMAWFITFSLLNNSE
jgi:hypothetical protein